jgi:digeranylgeranylglycerophospholipid reductase
VLRCDVAVAGAGPIGCYCAWQLASRGFEVLVLEEHESVGLPQHCTGVIGLEAFRRFDLPESCIERTLSRASMFSPGGERLDIDGRSPQAAIVDRCAFDRELASRAEKAGAQVLLGTRADAFIPGEDGITVRALDASGGVDLRASLCLAATGIAGRLLTEAGLAASARYIHGARAEVKSNGLREVEIYFGRSVVPGGFAWAVPGTNGTARVGMAGPARVGSMLRHFLRTGPVSKKLLLNGEKVQCRPIPVAPFRPSFAERILAVGDAAGQVKTTTGGGVFYGLLGAEAAVATVGMAFDRGDFSAALLSRYESEWMKAIGAEQRAGLLFRRVGSMLSDRHIDAVFRTLRVTGLSTRLARAAHFDWHARPTLLALAMGTAARVAGLGLVRGRQ